MLSKNMCALLLAILIVYTAIKWIKTKSNLPIASLIFLVLVNRQFNWLLFFYEQDQYMVLNLKSRYVNNSVCCRVFCILMKNVRKSVLRANVNSCTNASTVFSRVVHKYLIIRICLTLSNICFSEINRLHQQIFLNFFILWAKFIMV